MRKARRALAVALFLVPVLSWGDAVSQRASSEDKSPLPPHPVRLSTDAFGGEARVEVRDLPEAAAESAARAALEEVLRLERLLAPEMAAEATDPESAEPGTAEPETRESRTSEPEPGSIAFLNARAGQGPQPVERPLLALLGRALDMCSWSQRANGPLGGRLFEAWGLHRPVKARPSAQELLTATGSAACGRLRLDREAGTATLEAGSRLDLWPFATGWAVDRALEIVREHGAGNAYAEVAGVRRGLGPGPDGRGWRVRLPVFPGYRQSLGTVWLQDEALAIAQHEDRFLEIAGDPIPPYWNQRTGQPAEGMVAVIAVSELGLDARGLATTMFVTGHLKGQFLLGQLRPTPSVRWLLGTGEGRPLLSDFNWMELRR